MERDTRSRLAALHLMKTRQERDAFMNTVEERQKGMVTLPRTNSEFTPENRPGPKGKGIIFQPSIFRGELVSFREGIRESFLLLPFVWESSTKRVCKKDSTTLKKID